MKSEKPQEIIMKLMIKHKIIFVYFDKSFQPKVRTSSKTKLQKNKKVNK